MRILAREVITSKDPLMDPQQRSEIDKRFLEQNMIIEALRNENSDLEQALHDREMEILRLKDNTQESQQAPRNQGRDTSLKDQRKHVKALKSKNREISKLKTDLATINKNLMSLKANSMTAQQAKSEKEKDRLKISDLLRQRSALESQMSNYKSDMFNKEKALSDQRSEIEKLKQQLEQQKSSEAKNKLEVEKYKELYNNAKTSTTPFSDSRIDYMTEATHGMKNTPTDMKSIGGKNYQVLSKNDVKFKQTPTPSIITSHDKSVKGEIEKKLDDSFEEILEKTYEEEPIQNNQQKVNEDIKYDIKSEEKQEEILELKQEILELKEESLDLKEESLDLKEETLELKEETLELKEEIVDEMQEDIEEEHADNKSVENDEKYSIEEDVVNKEVSPDNENQSKNESEEMPNEVITITEPHKPDIAELTPKDQPSHNNSLSKKSPDSHSDKDSKSSKASSIGDTKKNIFKSRVSIVDIPKIAKVEFRLILQNKKIPFEKMIKIFPNTKRVELQQLINHFKSFGRFESDIMLEHICRYLGRF